MTAATGGIVVRRVASDAELQAALAVRDDVFVVEQGVESAADRDGRDPEAIQLVAVRDGEIVGTCRVLVERNGFAKFGRLAVRREARGHGVGSRLLELAIAEAAAAGARSMGLHAQTTAYGLYVRHGFAPHGERFLEEGIEHVAMYRTL